MNRPLPAPASDVALVVARLILAVVMFAHGYQKLFIQGIGKTTDGFQAMNIPLAIVSASFVTVVEVAGSVLLVAGALTTVVCGLMLFEMIGAAVFVHLQHGLFVQQGGAEYVIVISALLVALAAAGPGRYSVDVWMRDRQKQYQRDLAAAKTATPAVTETGSFTPAVSGTGSFAPAVPPAVSGTGSFQPVRPASTPARAYVPAPSAPLSFAPAVPVDAPMTDPRPFTLPAPFAPEPSDSRPSVPAPSAPTPSDAAPVTEALPVMLPVRRTRPAHASR